MTQQPPRTYAVLRLSAPQITKTLTIIQSSYLVPIQADEKEDFKASGITLAGRKTYITGSVAVKGKLDFLVFTV